MHAPKLAYAGIVGRVDLKIHLMPFCTLTTSLKCVCILQFLAYQPNILFEKDLFQVLYLFFNSAGVFSRNIAAVSAIKALPALIHVKNLLEIMVGNKWRDVDALHSLSGRDVRKKQHSR